MIDSIPVFKARSPGAMSKTVDAKSISSFTPCKAFSSSQKRVHSQIVGALTLTASGTVSEKISPKRVGPVVGKRRRAAPNPAPMMICIDDVDGPFVIVLVALLAVCDLNVPTQVIVKDSSAQTEHLLKQVGMPFGVMRFNDDDHDGNTFALSKKHFNGYGNADAHCGQSWLLTN
jgi:hypothetical protein